VSLLYCVSSVFFCFCICFILLLRGPVFLIREEVLSSNLVKYPQQCEFTMLRKDKNNNGKMNLETLIKGKKDRKLNKRKAKLEKL
jgi:hypothetical protein